MFGKISVVGAHVRHARMVDRETRLGRRGGDVAAAEARFRLGLLALEEKNAQEAIRQIERAVSKVMTATDDKPMEVTRQAPRQVRMFSTSTRISFSQDPRGRTLMELIAGDRPGLLSEVGKVLLNAGVAIHTARIMTIGERAEDVFYICRESGGALDRQQQETLGAALLERLDSTTRT